MNHFGFWIVDFGLWIGSDGRSSTARSSMNPKCGRLIVALIVLLCMTGAGFADAITFAGSSIPLRQCKIEAIQAGEVRYTDSAGQSQRRPIEKVQALAFDGLPELDDAERAIARENYQDGLEALLSAMLKAGSDVQKLWLRARLAQIYDLQHEYVQAAGHAAAAMLMSDDPSWHRLEPTGDVNRPTYAAAKEALENLQAAARRIKTAQNKAALDRMLGKVKPVYDQLAKSYSGKPIAANTTISGISKQEIAKQRGQSASSKPANEAIGPPAKKPDAEKSPGRSSTAERPAAPVVAAQNEPSEPDSPRAIDVLLGQSNWSEALSACRRIAANPGERDLGHFLFQYGSALSRSGRSDDAAVMFTRCAVLYPDSADATQSLIQTAMIYRDEYHQPQTARRLLQQAAEQAAAHGQESAAMLARELLESS